MTILDPLTALERECKCYEDPSWCSQDAARSSPICGTFEPMSMDPGICVNCEHDEACHAEVAPAIDYRAHCEALAGALEDMLRIYGSDFDEECLRKDEVERAFLDLARAALTRWKEDSK